MKRTLLTLLTAAVFVLGGASAALAQVNAGEISGKVVGTDNLVLPGVAVTIQGDKLPGGTLATTTTEQGLYRFPRVPAGTYVLEFKIPNFKTLRLEAIKVDIGSKLELNAVLEMSKLANEVTVIAQKPLIDQERPSYNVTIDTKTLMALPVNKAGTALNAASYNAGDTYFGSTFGAAWPTNNYVVDGATVNHPQNGEPYIRPNLESVEEVEYSYGGAPAEYGNFIGSNIKIVTKTGSNTLAGHVGISYTTDSLQSTNSSLPITTKTPVNYVPAFNLGGPLVKDHLFFFIDLAGYPTQTSYNFTSTRSSYNTYEGKAKVTLDWDKNNKTDANLFLAINKSQNGQLGLQGYGPLMQASSLQDMQLTRDQFALNHTSFLSRDVVLDVGVNYLWSHWDAPHTRTGLPGVWNTITNTISGTIGNPTSTQDAGMYKDNHDGTFEASAKLTYFNDNLAGTHEFKLGFVYNHSFDDAYQAYEGGYFEQDFLYTVMPGLTVPAIAHLTQTPYDAREDVEQWSAFLQDSWKIGERLTLAIGLRYDDTKGLINDQPQKDGSTIKGFADPVAHFKTLSPRLALNYRLTEDGKTMFRINWGRYYPATRTETFASLNPAIGPVTTWLAIPAIGMPLTPIQVTSNVAASWDSNLKNFYNDVFSVSLERELLPNISLSLHYMKKWNGNFYGLIPRQTYAPLAVVDPYNNQTITVYQQTSASNWYFTNIPASSNLYSNYDSFAIELTKKFTDDWTASFSYFYEHATGTAENAYNTSQLGGGFYGYKLDPNYMINWDGPLGQNSPHQVKLFTSYQFPWEITASLFATYHRGLPWTRLLYINPALGVTVGDVYAEPKGSRRLPDQFNVDFTIQKSFHVAGPFQVELYIQAFNLFNAGTAISVYNETGGMTNALFGQASAVVNPRRVFLGANVRW